MMFLSYPYNDVIKFNYCDTKRCKTLAYVEKDNNATFNRLCHSHESPLTHFLKSLIIVTNGLSHLYHLGASSSIFRGIRSSFSFFFFVSFSVEN